eukprot:5948380-Prymnesium_polylepis.1
MLVRGPAGICAQVWFRSIFWSKYLLAAHSVAVHLTPDQSARSADEHAVLVSAARRLGVPLYPSRSPTRRARSPAYLRVSAHFRVHRHLSVLAHRPHHASVGARSGHHHAAERCAGSLAAVRCFVPAAGLTFE